MWKDYLSGSFRKNKSAVVFIVITVFMASLFMSTLLAVFYNVYVDAIKRSGAVGANTLVFFYAGIFVLVCISWMLIIRGVFRFSLGARVYQLGILGSVGATPGQIRALLMWDALIPGAVPAIAGTLLGIVLCRGFVRYAGSLAAGLNIEQAAFVYHPSLFFITIAFVGLTLLVSAWFPARALSRITPLQAIRGGADPEGGRVKRFRIISAIWGIEGELARKSLYRRRKAFRTAAVCLAISFLLVTLFLNFMTISELSVRYSLADRPEMVAGNAKIYAAYTRLVKVFCAFLAFIGIANVFANTLGYVFARRREFACLGSLGLTPGGMGKMLLAEALVLGFKPVLLSIPVNVLFIGYAVSATKVTMTEFIRNMPLGTFALFLAAILAAIGLSYYIGWKRLKKLNSVDDLKNNAMFG